jgi:hypothetical protein
MGNCKEPESVGHLFLGQICPSHMDHHLPVQFYQAIGGLMLGRGRHHLRTIVNKIFGDSHPKKLSIAITVTAPGKRTSCSAEEPNSHQNTAG